MKLLAAISLYIGLLILEVSVLPRLIEGIPPLLTLAGLVVGLARLEFRSGFWFAGCAGLLHDTVLAGASSFTIFALTVFLVMHTFRALTQWDVPIAAIATVAVGLLSAPLAWVAASVAASAFFGLPRHSIEFGDLVHRTALQEVIFSSLWFSAFAWFLIRRFRWQRARELVRLSAM